MLEAPAGQQINVSLLDFGQRARDPANQHHCSQQYGYIVDKAAAATMKNVSICGLEDAREKNVYQSISNVLEIVLVQMDEENDDLQQALIGLKGISPRQ